MSDVPLIAVVMAGGTGSRLWPLSRELYPKQFLQFSGENSLLQTTLLRLSALACKDPLVITNEQHRFIVAEQLRQIDQLHDNIILEPCGRNTAPAIALAAFSALKRNEQEDPLLLVLAADHVIAKENVFCNAIKKAVPIAENGNIVTFGIIPEYAETGYGYIERGALFSVNGNSTETSFYHVRNFVEKPDRLTAEKYISTGNYFWNSGMFMFKASVYLNELKKFRPDIYSVCEQVVSASYRDLDFIRIPEALFKDCPAESIDFAVMEKTEHCILCPIDIGWSDVGSWQSLWDISEKTDEGDVCKGDILTYNTKNNYIYSESALVAAVGVEDIVIVQTKDAILVSKKSDVQDVKKIVEMLKARDRTEYISHHEVFRPWGKFDSIDQGERYKVKKIIVKPGEGLSLRMHHHRSEHWIVLSGTAKVTLDDKTMLITANESIYIPLGATYSLENPGVIPLNLIEVSSGDYLGEDDIVRQKERYRKDN
ncbi:mannose-1-phosphate guanylyltransferase/mannose-6-phosphate isomerase [Salmonella enterica]|uniref:mannose-1-phosphate guanylyltransferase n=1 Tax=Salmonella enterica subsp. salamae serovar Greenside TaxID=297361 RepID=Q9EXX5_SALER|nr:mannose-1-P guanosyltransferase [Salmonella enterica subsp. salamae serovar Greenside]EAZ4874571.1 mannose-1-phosphate guanylyltransferase/mannose-6-phosphate isomerase [Salmonella enterica]ECI4598955.1 mannose-1-phosphate guanylyltransferase/mannose-6-phosphate isomerase [Salmonella enterica subsp. salamae]ECF6031869.1 mannose-1-phosphate guanylyltransferase/mannose-6-phosphate isomerase [Salmonella enterica subsp. salamae serovar Greenside]SQI55380.1 mannose-1-phosphate guanyltransferase [